MSNNSPVKGFRKLGGAQPENAEQEKIPPAPQPAATNLWQQPISPVQPPPQQVSPSVPPPATHVWQQPPAPSVQPTTPSPSAMPANDIWQQPIPPAPPPPATNVWQQPPAPSIQPTMPPPSAPPQPTAGNWQQPRSSTPPNIGWNTSSAYSKKRSQAIQDLRKKFGAEVAHGQALLTGLGPYADKTVKIFEYLWHQRNIPSTTIEHYSYKGTEQYLLLEQMYVEKKQIIGQVLKDRATIAIQIVPYGNDLVVEYWHFEDSPSLASTKFVRFWILFFLGTLLLFVGGIGFLVIIYGFYQLTTKNLEGDAKEQSQLLNQMMQETLAMAVSLAIHVE